MVWPVHSGECLQQVVRLDGAAQVELLKPVRVEAGEQHVEHDEYVDGAVVLLEAVADFAAVLLGALVVQDEPALYVLLAVIIQGEPDGDVWIELAELGVYAPGLRCAVGHDHGAYRLVPELYLALQVVGHDVVHERVYVLVVHEHVLDVHELVYLAQLAHDFLHLEPELGAYVLAKQLECVAVRDRLVVEVLVDVVPEHLSRVVAALGVDERRPREREPDGIAVRGHEVGEEGAAVLVVSVRLVDEVDALHVESVVELDSGRLLVELLDVHDGDDGCLNVAHGVRVVARALQGLDELRLAVHHADDCAACPELVGGLVCEVEPVDDEEEPRYLVLRLVVVAKVPCQEE